MAEEVRSITLAELAEIDVAQVDEIRFEVLPKMVGEWEITDCKAEALGKDDKTAIVIVAKPISIVQVLDDNYKTEEDKSKLLEKEHREAFFIKDADDVGRFKAFCVDTGQVDMPTKEEAKASGVRIPVSQLMEAIKGVRFPGKIEHRPRKDDPDKVNANLRPIVTKPADKK